MLLADWLSAISSNKWVILTLINIFLLILGCLMETLPAMLITVPMFLPLIHAAISYLAQAGGADPREEHLVGSDLRFELPPRWGAEIAQLRVRTERGSEIKPMVSQGEDDRTEVLVPQPREVGYYTLLADTTRIAEASVNIDTRESNLNPLPIRDIAPEGAGVIDPGGDLARDIRRQTEGREIYALFLAFAVAALVAEAVLGRKA